MVGFDDRLFLFRQALRAGKFPNLWIPLGYAIGIAGEQEYQLAQNSHVAKVRKDPTPFIHQHGFTGERQRLDKVILYGLTAPVTPHHLYTVWSHKKEDAAAFPDGGTVLVSQIWDSGFPFFQGHESAPPKKDSRFKAGLTDHYDSVTLTALLDGLKTSLNGRFAERELWGQINKRRHQSPTHALEYIAPKDSTKTRNAHRPRSGPRNTSSEVQIVDINAMDLSSQPAVGNGSSAQPFHVSSDTDDAQDIEMQQADESQNRTSTAATEDQLETSFDPIKIEKPDDPGTPRPPKQNGNKDQPPQFPPNSMH